MARLVPILILSVSMVCFLVTRDNYEPKSVSGKHVLITGASSGIGEQIARHYAELNARLVLTARRGDLLNEVARECRKLGAPQVTVIVADVSQPEDRVRLLKEAEAALDGRLDNLILNHAQLRAAIWRGTPNNVTVLRTDMNTNFFSYAELASLAFPLLESSRGRLGVVSSVAAKIGSPLSSTYCASKFAVQGFFTSWRQELVYRRSPVSITLAVLGPIATDAARQMVRAVRPGADMTTISASPRDTARAIVRAVETRVYQLNYGWMATFMLWTHKFFPETLENFITRDYLSELVIEP